MTVGNKFVCHVVHVVRDDLLATRLQRIVVLLHALEFATAGAVIHSQRVTGTGRPVLLYVALNCNTKISVGIRS
jgi:hypothetical protein